MHLFYFAHDAPVNDTNNWPVFLGITVLASLAVLGAAHLLSRVRVKK